jgi:4'-phosphopantetheinyl transferase EntD
LGELHLFGPRPRVILNQIEDQFRVWFGSDAGVCISLVSEKPLYPEERAFVEGAVPHRMAEFSTGRWCAREAMRAIGAAPVPIPVGPRHGPLWPQAVTGSISHAGGICAAIVGPASRYAGIGIDLLEIVPAVAALEATEAILMSEQEREFPTIVAGVDPRVLRFSAKESVIKVVSREADRWIEFTEITVHFTDSRFEAVVLGFKEPISGWWTVCGDFLLTAAVRNS